MKKMKLSDLLEIIGHFFIQVNQWTYLNAIMLIFYGQK